MSYRPLISDSEKDKHKTRSQLLNELSELRARLAATTEDLTRCDRVVGMLDGIKEPVFVLDDESQVVYSNSEAVRLFATGREAIEGRSLLDVYPKRPDTLFYNAYEKARKGRSTCKFLENHRLLGKWFEVYLYPVPGGMTVLFKDVTVSRHMEELPRLALTLLHNLKDNVFLLRADGRMFHVNNETKNSLGYSSDDLHKMSIFDVVPPSYANEWHDILDRIRLHGSMTFESLLRARDGHVFPVEVYSSFIELYGSSYYTVSARDITERKQIEEALIAAEDFNRSVLDSLTSNIAVLDETGAIIYVNEGWKKFAGENDISSVGAAGVGINYFDVCRNSSGSHAEEAPAALEGMMSVLAGETDLFELEYPCHSPDTRRWFLMRVTPFMGRKKHGIVVYHNDITARKIVEEALRESEASLAQAQQIAHIGSWEWDFVQNKDKWSAETYRIFGIEPEELSGDFGSFIGRVHPDDKDYVRTTEEKAIREQKPCSYGYRIILPDGSVRHVHNEAEIECDGNGKAAKLRGTVQDITERKQAEADLEESYRKFRQIMDNVDEVIFMFTPDWREAVYVSPAYEKIWGRPVEEVYRDARSWMEAIVPGDRGRLDAFIDGQARGEIALENGIEYRIRTPDGDVRWVSGRTYPVMDKRWDISRIAGVAEDITERKQAEEALQVARAQAELYVDLMGHDINNMNQIAMASLEIALMDLEQAGKSDASVIPLLETSMKSLNSSSQLIGNVQKLQRASTEGNCLNAVDAAAIMENVIREFRQVPGKELTIDFSRNGDCMVNANALIEDVFSNLIGNAIKHSTAGRPLTIVISADNVVEHGKKCCRFIIEDNGPGIPDQTKEKLFNRFARGRTKARGSGLGLYLVKTLVEHYGGWIRVEDRVPGDHGQGARFVVMIPSVE